MDDGSPTLEVGFAIETGVSFDELTRLSTLIDSATAAAVSEFAKVEKASASALSLGGAKASITAFGSDVTRASQAAARELAKVEKSGESLSRSLDRQASSFGKTSSEIRAMKVETAALAAEQQGLTELAERLRAQEAALYAQEFAAARQASLAADAAAQDKVAAAAQAAAAAEAEATQVREAAQAYQLFEAAARQGAAAMREVEAAEKAAAATAVATQVREAAQAYQLFEAAARRGMAAMRETEAAELAAATEAERLANAAGRLRASIDPAYAAQQRFDQEMTNARTLIGAGAITLDEYVAKLRIERAVLDEASSAQARGAESAGAHRAAMAGLGFQVQDTFTQISMGANPLSVLAIQGGQAAGQMVFLGGKLGAVANFLVGPWGLAITGALLVLGALTKGMFDNEEATKKAADALKKFQDRQSDIGNFIDATTGKLIEQNKILVTNAILLRQKQIAENDEATSSARRQALSMGAAQANPLTGGSIGQRLLAGAAVAGGASAGDLRDRDVAKLYAAAAGDVDKFTTSIANLAATKRPDLKTFALNLSQQAGQAVIAQRENEKLRKELRALGGDTTALSQGTSSLIDKQVALATATTPLAQARAKLALVQAGGAAADKAGGAALVKYRDDLTKATVAVNAAEAAQKAAADAKRAGTKEANAAAAEARKEQTHADDLAREAAAVESQIKNLGLLADAYGVSGAAALVAEAREKAESAAIKARGDAEAFVDRQVRLVLAQRVADAAKSTAAMNDQAAAQEQVNGMVAAGLVPAARAAEMVRNRIADLPLLQVIEAAQQRGLATEAARATRALNDQIAARERDAAAAREAQFLADMSASADELARLRLEAQLIDATTEARVHALAVLKATQDAQRAGWSGEQASDFVKVQVAIADQAQANSSAQARFNGDLRLTADLANSAAESMSKAFGKVGDAIGGVIKVLGEYGERQAEIEKDVKAGNLTVQQGQRKTADLQIGSLIDITDAAKGLFKEHSKGYQAMAAAEKALTIIQLARTAIDVAGGAARMFSTLGPFAFPAVAAMLGVMASLGFAGGGGSSYKPVTNDGTGTVLGDSTAKSDSIKRSIDLLKNVDTVTMNTSRDMLASLRSIDSQIGNLASLLVQTGNLSDSASGVTEGFKTSTLGKVLGSTLIDPTGLLAKIPVIGGIFKAIGGVINSLFGTKTKVIAQGLYADSQSLGGILSGGFDATTYSDIQKKKKFLGVTTSTKVKTQYGDLDDDIQNQFGLILKSFDDAITAAGGPLGIATSDIAKKLDSFVVNIGKIDLQGLSGTEIQDKLQAVFGAVGDDMAKAAIPGLEKYEQVGEGYLETLTRVATTVETVTSTLVKLGDASASLGIDASMGIAKQFDSLSDFSSAADAYFQSYYSQAEQAAAMTAQLGSVFNSLGLQMPDTLAGFRALVEAQDLTTAAGQSTYATLLQLAPAFANLKTSLEGAKSAADILSEREDLQRQLLEAQGNTAATRALDLAKLDASNRALQQQIWDVQDAKAAADAAKQLADAWKSVGDTIGDEINRIRGINDASGGSSFASLMGQFNAATASARAGDMDAAKSLPGLSQALLTAAADAATSRQELDRVQAQTASSLETTNSLIAQLTGASTAASPSTVIAASQAGGDTKASATVSLADEIAALGDKIEQLRADNNLGHAATAGQVGQTNKRLADVTAAAGGEAISVTSVAA